MRADLIMSILMGGVFVYAITESDQWSYGSALFPRVIGAAGLICVAALLFVSLVLRRVPTAEMPPTPGAQADEPAPEASRAMAARFLAWLVGIVAAAWLFGQLAALTGFILLYLRFESGLSWFRSASAAAVSWAFLYAVFELLLKITWLQGALWRWTGWL